MRADPAIITSVCICTYRRPRWLREALESLRSSVAHSGPHEVIVVDNDPESTANDIVSNFEFGDGTTLLYYRESTRNISIARNRAVKEASGQYLAMIDDDEFASADWLEHLMRAARTHDADIVLGPVLPVFEGGTPAWIIEGGFFDRPRKPTGTRVDWHEARTGNALIRRELATSTNGPFSEAFGLTGGEDSHFFRSLGPEARMIWCDEAIVYEHVPLIRANPRWLLGRSFRTGQTWTRIELDSSGGAHWAKTLQIGVVAGLRIAATLPMILLTAPTSTTQCFRHLRTVANRTGKLAALLGHRQKGY